MSIPQVSLLPCDVSVVATGGQSVAPIPANPTGGFLQNPIYDADQGVTAEVLYVDPINIPGSTPGSANGTCFLLQPGQFWPVIPGQTTPTRVNAATSGHKFSGIYWKS